MTTGHKGAGTRSVQGATDFLREIALEDITFFDVVVAINQHATFIAEATSLASSLNVSVGSSDGPLDDDVVPVTRICASSNTAAGHITTRNHANLGDSNTAPPQLDPRPRVSTPDQATFSGSFHIIDEFINDVVVPDVNALGFACFRALPEAVTLKPMMMAPVASARVTSESLIPPTAECLMVTLTSSEPILPS